MGEKRGRLSEIDDRKRRFLLRRSARAPLKKPIHFNHGRFYCVCIHRLSPSRASFASNQFHLLFGGFTTLHIGFRAFVPPPLTL